MTTTPKINYSHAPAFGDLAYYIHEDGPLDGIVIQYNDLQVLNESEEVSYHVDVVLGDVAVEHKEYLATVSGELLYQLLQEWFDATE